MIARIKKYINTYRQYDWHSIGNGHGFLAVLDCLKSRVVDGTNTEQFITLEFYRKSQGERKLFVTNRKTVRLDKLSVSGASNEELESIRDKTAFNRKYSKFVKRGFLATKDASPTAVEEFIKCYGKVIVKPIASTQGRGIAIIEYAQDSIKAWTQKLAFSDYIVEQYITQHPAMNRINPTSVNTVRICTVLDASHTAHVIGAGLRCGGAGSYVDNFHHGGVAYPIDIEHGVVCGRGKKTSDHKLYSCHPATGTLMLGFAIPHWDMVMQSAKEAAEMSDRVAYLGWDIAVTEDGVEIIEANDGQGCTMWQLDNVGKYPKICSLIRK